MELVYVTVVGLGIGAVLRYLLPGRSAYGILLLPAVGAAVAAAAWMIMTWLGWRADGGWIWVVALSASGVVSIAAALLTVRQRARSDERMLTRLSRPA